MHRIKLILAALTVSTLVMGSSSSADDLHPKVRFKTTLGDIVIELDGEKAPISTLNFLQYVEDGYYNGTVFHRVIANFMIQGGGFDKNMDKKTSGLRSPIKNEWRNGLKNVRGTLAMARTSAPDSATSQFFINVVDNANLDRPNGGAAYAVFGKVVEGMGTVDKIRDTELGPHAKYGGGRSNVVPVTPVVVTTAETVGSVNRKAIDAEVAKAKIAQEQAAAKAKLAQLEAIRKGKEAMQEHVKKFEAETGKTAVTTDSGLVMIELVAGDGATPQPNDRVEVHYTGWLLDGTKFDSSVDRGTPATFPVGGVIRGWTEALLTMKVGQKSKLIIPSELAYGSRGRPSIPANSVLVFDVELLGIK